MHRMLRERERERERGQSGAVRAHHVLSYDSDGVLAGEVSAC